MADKHKMVDHPEYDPDGRVPFPPQKGQKSPFGKSPEAKKPEDAPAKTPYYENYVPDPANPDPSQTVPGAPDIRDPDTRLPEDADLSKLSPNIDLKE